MLCECSACSLGARVNMLCVWTGALGSSTAGRCEEGRKVLNSGSRSCGCQSQCSVKAEEG